MDHRVGELSDREADADSEILGGDVQPATARLRLEKLPGILECHLVSGDYDYLIKARIPEMNAYRKLLGDMLLALPGARESRSYIVMEEIVERLEIEIAEPARGEASRR